MNIHNRRTHLLFLVLVLFVLPVGASAQHRTGLLFEDDDRYHNIPLADLPVRGAELDPSLDLSGHFPRPGNQGQQGSCVGWAVAYALKSYQEHVERGWYVDHPEHVFSPAYIYNQIKLGRDGGSYISDALRLVEKEGVATLADFPYDETTTSREPDAYVKQKAREYAIATWRRVNPQSTTEIKSHLSAGFPVIISSLVDQAFNDLTTGKVYRRTTDTGPGDAGHAMVVVGYDDNKAGGAFKIINSWGTGWGDNGFCWIEYDTFHKIVRQAFAAHDIIINAPAGPEQLTTTPFATIRRVWVDHNDVENGETGMRIHTNIETNDLQGKDVRVVGYFYRDDGTPLNDTDNSYNTSSGQVSVGRGTTVSTAGTTWDDFDMFLPYNQLHIAPGTGQNALKFNINVWDMSGAAPERLASSDWVSFTYTAPSVTLPTASISNTWAEHNVYENNEIGMRLHNTLEINNLWNKNIKMSAYFHFENGNRLNDFDGAYRTEDGQVSVGQDAVVMYQQSIWNDFVLFIPYSQLHITAGSGQHSLKYYIVVYDMSSGSAVELTRSDWINFLYTAPSSPESNAVVHNSWVEHNIFENNQTGMRLHTHFEVSNMINQNVNVVAYFFFDDGTQVRDFDGYYTSSDGQVSVGLSSTAIYDRSIWNDYVIFMPYDQLHMGTGRFDLKYYVVVWDMSTATPRELARSGWIRFWYSR